MATIVKATKIKREKGRMYFVDKSWNIASVTMARGKKGKRVKKIEAKTGITREKGYLYFVDKGGNLAKTKMSRGKKKKK